MSPGDTGGWAKLHRKLKDHRIWKKPPAWGKLFCHLIMSSDWSERPGQVETTLEELAAACHVSKQQVRDTLSFLSSEDTITVGKQTRLAGQGRGGGGLLVTLTKWTEYQAILGENTQKNTQTTTQNRQLTRTDSITSECGLGGENTQKNTQK